MGSRKIIKSVKIEDIFFDEDLYPRTQSNWQTSYDYAQSMKTGSKFPMIILALLNKKLYLVDGKHRLEAYKQLKVKSVKAVIYTGWNKKKIFEEAIKFNIAHGRGLSPYEKRLIAQKLLELKYKNKDISNLIQVPMDKLKTFVAERIVNTLTAYNDSAEESQRITSVIVKSGGKHLKGTMVEDIENIQEDWSMHSQEDLLKQFLTLLDNKLLDKHNPKVISLFAKIKIAIRKYKF